jgi:hypothetical protein
VDVGAANTNGIPKDRKGEAMPTRKGVQRMTVLAGLFHAGFSYKDIARQTGYSVELIRKDVALATKHFNLADRLQKSLIRLDTEAVPLAIDRLVETLEDDSAEAAPHRREAMYRTLEGRGAFRSYVSGDGKGGGGAPAQMALQVNFTTPAGMTLPAQTAQIVGAVRTVDPAPGTDPVHSPPAPASSDFD